MQGTSPKGHDAQFIARGRVLRVPGWRAFGGKEEDGDDEDESIALPKLKAGETLTPASGQCEGKMTKAPAPYTEASLVKHLEELGIGRPSTFASLISNLEKREYIAIDKKRVISPLPRGELVVNMLVGKFQFMNYDFTRGVENLLDQIAEGKFAYEALMQHVDTVLTDELEHFTAPGVNDIPYELRSKMHTEPYETYECPTCKSGRISRKKGAKGYFWGCSNFNRDNPEAGCRHTQADEKGKPGVITTRGSKTPAGA